MQRRLIAIIISVVVGAILLTGVVTLALAGYAARDRTRRQLVAQATGFAAGIKGQVDNLSKTAPPGRPSDTLLRIFKVPLHIEADAIVAIGPGGVVFDILTPRQVVSLPSGLRPADLHTDELVDGQTVSGVRGSVVYAAAPFRAQARVGGVVTELTQVVILTRKPSTGLREAAPWFLLSASLVLLVAAVVADRLGRRISRPLRAAEAVTRRIAAGDLDAQVPMPDHSFPELESLARSINTMAESLARSRGLERQFLLAVSHELRTPLTSIRGFAEAIADGAAPDNIRAAEVITSEARRLERLVRDLLDLAKLDARRFGLDLRRVDLSEIVADSGEGFRPAAEDLGLHLSVEAGETGTIGATADPDRLAQVVANLVENALKYASSEVRVAARSSGSQAVIWVDDDGPGIATEDLPKVFDRLFSVSRHPARPVGSGLGLAIVAELVGAMGGSVRAESPLREAGGTRMVVTLQSWSAIPTSLSAV